MSNSNREIKVHYKLDGNTYERLKSGKYYVSLRLAVASQDTSTLLTNSVRDGVRSVLNDLGRKKGLETLNIQITENDFFGGFQLVFKEIKGIYILKITFGNLSLSELEKILTS